jgi:hypothetical protein
MPVEPTKRIYETPVVRKEDHATLYPKKNKPKQQKKEPEKEPGKVDIKV